MSPLVHPVLVRLAIAVHVECCLVMHAARCGCTRIRPPTHPHIRTHARTHTHARARAHTQPPRAHSHPSEQTYIHVCDGLISVWHTLTHTCGTRAQLRSHVHIHEITDECMVNQKDGSPGGWLSGSVDERADRWSHRQTDRQTDGHAGGGKDW